MKRNETYYAEAVPAYGEQPDIIIRGSFEAEIVRTGSYRGHTKQKEPK